MNHLHVPLPPGDDDFEPPVQPAAAATDVLAAALLVIQQQSQAMQQQQGIFLQQMQQWQAGGAGRQRDAAAAPMPNKVKLPPFWEKDAAAWFRSADETLEECNIGEARAKYRAVLLHIPQHLVERARGVINAADAAADPYDELKRRLVELLTPSKLDQVNSLIWGPELGGRRPSELMDGMLAALPPGETAGLLFKGLFLHRLPKDMKELVALQFTTLAAKELAQYADAIWDSRNAKKATVAAVATTEVTEEGSALEKAVAALALNRQPRKSNTRDGKTDKRRAGREGRNKQGGGQESSQGGGQRGKYLCSRHLRFGDKAWNCEEPQECQFSEN